MSSTASRSARRRGGCHVVKRLQQARVLISNVLGTRRSDYEIVGEAVHGVEAVDKYKELNPDLVTMDIVMPFKSGIEATKEILAHDSNATIIMCSALGQESLVMEAIEAGAADFIVKPFKADDVLAVVNKVLGGKG